MIHFAIDRSPETTAKLGHPQIVAFTERTACTGYVNADRAHRHKLNKADASRLVKLFYGVSLDDALMEGRI